MESTHIRTRTAANNNQKGFIKIIVTIVIALVLLRILGINILDILDKPWFKELAVYIKDMLKQVWVDIKLIFEFFVKA